MTDYAGGIFFGPQKGKVFAYVVTPRRFRKPKIRIVQPWEQVFVELSRDGADNLRNMVIDPGDFAPVLDK